jgi:hypothetical protein
MVEIMESEQKTLCDTENYPHPITSTESSEEYIPYSRLLQRGLTEATIMIFMDPPDKEAPNPHYRNGYPMKLYSLQRIKQIEETEEFKQVQGQNGYRKAASRKATATKRKKLLDRVNKWEVHINQQNTEELFNASIENYNFYHRDRSEDGFAYEPASMGSTIDFIHRITVNYLRHQWTTYDRKLIDIKGKVGVKEAFVLINQKIYNKISSIYPQLKEECDRQLQEKIDKIIKESL